MNAKEELRSIISEQHATAKQALTEASNSTIDYEAEFILEEIFQRCKNFKIPIKEISLRIVCTDTNTITLSFSPNSPVTHTSRIYINQIESIPKLVNALLEMGFVECGKWYKYTFDGMHNP